MHELSLAMALVEQIEQAAEKEGAEAVVAIDVRLGALSGVERDPFEFCFPLAAEGSLLEGAELRIEAVPLSVRCAACGRESAPERLEICCAHCGSGAVEILAGREFTVSSMEIV